jgi:hypothetical protein
MTNICNAGVRCREMKRVNIKKWARLAAVVAVFAVLLVLPQPIQQYTALGQGYGYDEQPPPTTGGGTSGATTSGGVFTQAVSFQSADQNLTVDIPRNTTGQTKGGDPLPEVRITAAPQAPDPPQDMGFIGLEYDLEPDGATFDPPISITFTYNPNWIPAGLGPDSLTVGYYDTDTEQWVMLDASDITIDPATNTISAKISHFTYYGVMAHTAPAKFTVSSLTYPTTSIAIAEKATISAMVANSGDVAGTHKVVLKINGVTVASKSVKVAGHDSKTVTFETVQGKAGSYKVEIDGQTGTFTVEAAAVKPVVIQSTVPTITAPSVTPAPSAPSVPAAPTPAPAPSPMLAIILSLVVTAIVAGIIVWYFGFRSA